MMSGLEHEQHPTKRGTAMEKESGFLLYYSISNFLLAEKATLNSVDISFSKRNQF